jgi:hypothetical protein
MATRGGRVKHLARDGSLHDGIVNVCPICKRERNQSRYNKQKAHGRRGSAWRKRRLAILNRDGWVCHDCGQLANSVHLDPAWGPQHELAPDEAFTSLCRRCHGRRDGGLELPRFRCHLGVRPRLLSVAPV